MGDITVHSKQIVLAATAVLAILLSSGFASAQDEADNTIEPQPLTKALAEFAEQTGMQLVYPSELTAGVDSKGASTEGPPDEILDELLASTGLEYEYVNDRTIAIAAQAGVDRATVKGGASDQRGASDSKNSRPTPILMAQNQTSPTQATSNRSSEGGTSIVTGKVTDARTGANLKGAKITIEETGQWTSTNDLGEFRFANVPASSATLTVSFLGYAGQSAVVGVRGDSALQNFALRGGSEIEEIVVFGQRSARAQALNLERTAENTTTVVSADLLGNVAGTTLSDALRRAPGVSFQQDFGTGDGTNIIVRGLAPDLNTIKFNGIELPVSNGLDRSATLSNILADSIDQVKINKSLLPSQDSAGIGGVIEIETKAPLDRPRRFARFALEYGRTDRDFLDDRLVSALFSGVFGNDEQLGLSASIQYRDRQQTNFGYSSQFQFGEYLPLGPGGLPNLTSILQIDPREAFPFEAGASTVFPVNSVSGYGLVETIDINGTLTGQWRLDDHTELKLDISKLKNESDRFLRNTAFGAPIGYSLRPVEALGGEMRQALGTLGSYFATQDYRLFGGVEDETDTYSFRGNSVKDKWTLKYTAAYTEGSLFRPGGVNSATLSFNDPTLILDNLLLPDAIDPIENRILSAFGPRRGNEFILPLLSEVGWNAFNDPANYDFSFAPGESDASGTNDRSIIELSTRYDFDRPHLKYVEIGAQWERSDAAFLRPLESTSYFPLSASSLADLGFSFEGTNLETIGRPNEGFAVLSISSARDLVDEIVNRTTGTNPTIGSSVFEFDSRFNDQFLRETELATYIQARVDVGRLEMIGGVRVSDLEVEANVLRQPNIFLPDFSQPLDAIERLTGIETVRSEDAVVLPRLLANYRFDDQLIVRGGYFRSVARPAINQLVAGNFLDLILAPFFGPAGDQPLLFVNQGNPGLEPAFTDNFELGLEFYDDQIGVYKVAVFYKEIDNLLETNALTNVSSLEGITLPDDPIFENLPDNLFVAGIRPANSEFDADIWGFELVVEKQLTSLPGAWGGLGVFANYAYTDSAKVQPYTWSKPVFDDANSLVDFEEETVNFANTRFSEQPKKSGTAGITYSMFAIDAILSYTYQDARQSFFQPNSLSTYYDSVDSLDFRGEYSIETDSLGNYRIFVEGTNLLQGSDEPQNSIGIGEYAGLASAISSSTYRGGRSFRVGVIGSF